MKAVTRIAMFALAYVGVGALLFPNPEGVPYYKDLIQGLIVGALVYFILSKTATNTAEGNKVFGNKGLDKKEKT